MFLLPEWFCFDCPRSMFERGNLRALFTWDDEHDPRGQCHVGFGGVLHAANADALQGKDGHQEADGTQDDAHNHQGSHCLQHGCRTWDKLTDKATSTWLIRLWFNKIKQPQSTSTKFLRNSKSINCELCHHQGMCNCEKCKTTTYSPPIAEGQHTVVCRMRTLWSRDSNRI